MKLTDSQLEDLLRQAPRPTPPAGLASQLERDLTQTLGAPRPPAADRNHAAAAPHAGGARRSEGGGWRRRWPLVLPGFAAAAFASWVVVQQVQIQSLEHTIAQQEASAASSPAALVADTATVGGTSRLELPDDRAEIARLRALVESLTQEVSGLEALQAENQRLLAAIAETRRTAAPEIAELRDRAESIKCVNNLKQIGLAARVYATDNSDTLPADVLAMKAELPTPAILICPADSTRTAAANWDTYSDANLSYEFLGRGPGASEFEPDRVMFRCPFHGNVLLCDGSVQMGLAKHPERFETRGNGLYVKAQSQPPAAPVGEMNEEMRRRYGLPPRTPVAGGPVTERSADSPPATFRMSPELMRRYGLQPPADADTNAPATAEPAVPAPQP